MAAAAAAGILLPVTEALRRFIRDHGPHLAVAAIVVLLGAMVALFANAPTASQRGLPVGVDRLVPDDDSQILRQSAVGVDAAKGYDAELIINGTRISGLMELDAKTGDLTRDGLNKNLESGLITYTPKPGGLVENLKKGKNCVQAVVWPTAVGRRAQHVATWCFLAA